MKLLAAVQGILLVLLMTGQCTAGENQVLPLRVLYVGNSKNQRSQDYAKFLKSRFAQATIADRVGFNPSQAAAVDVVVLDWAQSETDVTKAQSPFGSLKEWSKPTVLLGSAGLLMAGSWQLIGGAG